MDAEYKERLKKQIKDIERNGGMVVIPPVKKDDQGKQYADISGMLQYSATKEGRRIIIRGVLLFISAFVLIFSLGFFTAFFNVQTSFVDPNVIYNVLNSSKETMQEVY